jgi:hypothetical protein
MARQLSPEQKAQKERLRQYDETVRTGRRAYVLIYADNRVLISADSQRQARDKFAMGFVLQRRAAPLTNEISVHEATEAEIAEFERHRPKPPDTLPMFDLDLVPTRAVARVNDGSHA